MKNPEVCISDLSLNTYLPNLHPCTRASCIVLIFQESVVLLFELCLRSSPASYTVIQIDHKATEIKKGPTLESWTLTLANLIFFELFGFKCLLRYYILIIQYQKLLAFMHAMYFFGKLEMGDFVNFASF